MHSGSRARGFTRFHNLTVWLAGLAVLAVGATGCSVRKFAVNKLGDALSKSSSGFASDDDPDLIKDAAPFSLKLIESLLAESPEHKGMLAAAAGGFTQYAYAFVQQDADELEAKDLAAADQLRARAKRLFVRARNHGLRGLAVKRPGFEAALRKEPKAAVMRCAKADVPLLYWSAAAWASVISLSKDNPETIADLPVVEALIDRALALDEAYGEGAIHSFLITYELSRPSGTGDPVARSRRHYERALVLAGGHQAGPLVSWAESVSVQKQDVDEFKALLTRALAVDVNARPDSRLVNLVMQRRARWLLSRVDELFLVAEPAPEPAN